MWQEREMGLDWRELLERLADGETLSEADARALAEALGAPPGRGEAAEWLRFEAALRERLAPPEGDRIALSRERLLAKALLREKHTSVVPPPGRAGRGAPAWAPPGGRPQGAAPTPAPRTRRVSRRTVAVAAVALLAVAAGILAGVRLRRPRHASSPPAAQQYAEPEASGEFRVLSPGRPVGENGPVRRGDQLVAGPRGARLAMGGYCALAIDPRSELIIQGEPGKEEIELTAGRVVSRITPARGQFRVRTPLGSLEVVGTEFITSVVPRPSQEGEEDMGRLRKAAVVTVLVISGAVAYHFGDAVGLLRAGGSQAFGGEEGAAPALPDSLSGFKGLLLGTITSKGERQFVLKIDRIAAAWKESKAENAEAAVGKEAKVVIPARMAVHFGHALAGLKVGDQIIVEAFHLDGEQLTVAELLRKAGVLSTEGQPREGAGHQPEGEGGHERLVPRKAAGEQPHGEAVVPREGGEHNAPHGEAVVPRGGFGGSNGLLVGTIVKKTEGDFVLKVEKVIPAPGRTLVEHPETLVGKEVEITVRREGSLHPQRSRDLAGLNPGDRIEVGVRRIEGNSFGAVSVLRKAEAAAESGRKEGEGIRREGEGRPRTEGERPEGEGVVRREGEAPTLREGFGGFQGLLVGTIVDKGENQFTLKVEKVGRSWHSSRAKSPESLVGKEVKLVVRGAEGMAQRLGRALAERQVGDRIEVGAQHIEGSVLGVIEGLRKAAAEGEGVRREGEGEHREGERLVPRKTEGRESTPASAEALQGFRGVLQGTIQGKTEDAIVVRIEKVAKVWQTSQAKNPEGLAGKTVRIAVKRAEGGGGLAAVLGTLKAGDRIQVGAVHSEGDHLVASETLRKVEGE